MSSVPSGDALETAVKSDRLPVSRSNLVRRVIRTSIDGMSSGSGGRRVLATFNASTSARMGLHQTKARPDGLITPFFPSWIALSTGNMSTGNVSLKDRNAPVGRQVHRKACSFERVFFWESLQRSF